MARLNLGTALDSRRNGLNAIRLAAATLVIVWHSFPLTGTPFETGPARQILSRISVDAFFAISGYLITSSWIRNPRWQDFLRARALRILPAFWFSLLVTAAVLAPVSTLLRTGAVPTELWPSAVRYVLSNSLLWVNQYDIAGTPSGVPYPHVWNGSMWTLAWEFLCYLGILLLGLTRLLERRLTLILAFGIALVAVAATSYGPVDNFFVVTGAHFGIMFLAGALIHQLRFRLPRSPMIMIAAVVVIVASGWLPDYRVVSAIPIAYLTIAVASYGRHRALQLRNDISYGTYIYAFPIQQLLAGAGLAAAGVALFAVVAILCTLPIAAASWFLIERPALRFKKRRISTLTGAQVAA